MRSILFHVMMSKFMLKNARQICLLSLLPMTTVHAEDAWRWSLAPYVWIVSLDGEQKTHDSGNDVDRPISIDMGAAVTGFEFGLLGHLEAQKSNWGWFIDGAYVALEMEADIGPLVVDHIGFDGMETEFAGVYHPGGANAPYDVFAGLRYWDLGVEVPITANIVAKRDVSWTDLMAGARYQTRLSDKWRLALRGDLAHGSSGSDLTVNVQAVAAIDVSKSGVFVFGWRYLDTKFVQGNKDDLNDDGYYELNISMSGPLLAYQFNW